MWRVRKTPRRLAWKKSRMVDQQKWEIKNKETFVGGMVWEGGGEEDQLNRPIHFHTQLMPSMCWHYKRKPHEVLVFMELHSIRKRQEIDKDTNK